MLWNATNHVIRQVLLFDLDDCLYQSHGVSQSVLQGIQGALGLWGPGWAGFL